MHSAHFFPRTYGWDRPEREKGERQWQLHKVSSPDELWPPQSQFHPRSWRTISFRCRSTSESPESSVEVSPSYAGSSGILANFISKTVSWALPLCHDLVGRACNNWWILIGCRQLQTPHKSDTIKLTDQNGVGLMDSIYRMNCRNGHGAQAELRRLACRKAISSARGQHKSSESGLVDFG